MARNNNVSFDQLSRQVAVLDHLLDRNIEFGNLDDDGNTLNHERSEQVVKSINALSKKLRQKESTFIDEQYASVGKQALSVFNGDKDELLSFIQHSDISKSNETVSKNE